MLTYKQLLQKCNRQVLDEILLNKTLSPYEGTNSLEKAKNIVEKGYNVTINTLLKKTGKTPELAIVIDLIPEEKFMYAGQEEVSPAYISVSYYNSRVEPFPTGASPDESHNVKYNRYLGFGLSPWEDFIDSDIVITPEAVLHIGLVNFYEKLAAEILWEQTFYGFTEADNSAFKASLDKRIEDLKSGKVKTFKLKKKKGDVFQIHIPEDMLAPTKKKRSNKKK